MCGVYDVWRVCGVYDVCLVRGAARDLVAAVCVPQQLVGPALAPLFEREEEREREKESERASERASEQARERGRKRVSERMKRCVAAEDQAACRI